MIAILMISIFLTLPAFAQQAADSVAPEISSKTTATTAKAPATAKDWMVTAANPHAVRAGAAVLEQGGTAADAMVAVQTVLGLVEPQSSGIGGGGFLVWYDGKTNQLTTLDGRETAPLSATPTLFQKPDGTPMEFYDAVVGGRSVGVPGIPALMQAAHDRWGQLEWATLFDPAIALAEDGFKVSPRLAHLIKDDAERLSRHPVTQAYFFPDGAPLAEGALLRNPDYATVLGEIAGQGAQAFYTGPIAKDIVTAVRNVADNPGVLGAMDMAIYQVRERPPVCAPYRGYEICGMGPPSSGAVAVGQILGQLEQYDLPNMSLADPQTWRLIGDSMRLAFADRGRYLVDSDFVPVPVKGLLDKDYLRTRGALLQGDDSLPEVTPGNPKFDHALMWADDVAIELPSTSHITIRDAFGNVLSMTSSVENAFGSRVMVRGFLLNNQLTDFSFKTHVDGIPIANRVEPGKRPRSSMAPTIVLKDGAPVLALGSPGGSRIIPYVAKTLIAHLDWGMDIQAAISLPHRLNRFGVYDLEEGTDAAEMADALQALGYEVSIRPLTSGLQGIVMSPDGLSGGADPRREGIVLGQ